MTNNDDILLEYVSHSIFQSNAQVIVNPVNCMGIMGAGLAKVFRYNYPINYNLYRNKCIDGCGLFPGKLFITYNYSEYGSNRSVEYDKNCEEHIVHSNSTKIVVNLPTKVHWKNKSCISNIRLGMAKLRDFIIENKISSIYIPRIGCGLGGLNWIDVEMMICEELSGVREVTVYLNNLNV